MTGQQQQQLFQLCSKQRQDIHTHTQRERDIAHETQDEREREMTEEGRRGRQDKAMDGKLLLTALLGGGGG